MPPPTQLELEAHEMRDLNTALAASLEPISLADAFPMSSYNLASNSAFANVPSTSSNVISGLSTASAGYDSFFSSLSMASHPSRAPSQLSSQLPGVQDSQSTMTHQASLSGAYHPPQKHPTTKRSTALRTPFSIETSGDRAASRIRHASNAPEDTPIATIDARLSKHMHPIWLNQYDERKKERAQGMKDQEQQKLFYLHSQRQFVLKFFNAVSRSAVSIYLGI
jgi:hypothetical protein